MVGGCLFHPPSLKLILKITLQIKYRSAMHAKPCTNQFTFGEPARVIQLVSYISFRSFKQFSILFAEHFTIFSAQKLGRVKYLQWHKFQKLDKSVRCKLWLCKIKFYTHFGDGQHSWRSWIWGRPAARILRGDHFSIKMETMNTQTVRILMPSQHKNTISRFVVSRSKNNR